MCRRWWDGYVVPRSPQDYSVEGETPGVHRTPVSVTAGDRNEWSRQDQGAPYVFESHPLTTFR